MYKNFSYFCVLVISGSRVCTQNVPLPQADILSVIKISASLKDVSVQWALRDLPAVQAQKEILLDVQSKIDAIEHLALDLDYPSKKVLWRILIYAAKNDYSNLYKVVVGKLARTYPGDDLSINFDFKRPKGWGEMEITPYSIAAYYKAGKILSFITEEKWRQAAQKKMAPLAQDKRLSLEKEFFNTDTKRSKKGIRVSDLLYAASFDLYNNVPDRSIIFALVDIPALASNTDLLRAFPADTILDKIDDRSKKIFWRLLVWASENDYVELFRAVVPRVAANFDEKRPAGWGKIAITPRSVAQFHKAKKILGYISQSPKEKNLKWSPSPRVKSKIIKGSPKQTRKIVRRRKGDRAARTLASKERVAQHKDDLKKHAKEKLDKAYDSPMTESIALKSNEKTSDD